MPDKSVRDEIAELAEAVRELRDREVADELRSLRAEVEKLRAERSTHVCAGHHCCSHAHCNWGHCGCWTTHFTYTNVAAGGALPLTCTVTNGGTNISMAPWTTTNVAAGCSTTLSIGN